MYNFDRMSELIDNTCRACQVYTQVPKSGSCDCVYAELEYLVNESRWRDPAKEMPPPCEVVLITIGKGWVTLGYHSNGVWYDEQSTKIETEVHHWRWRPEEEVDEDD